MDSEELLLDRSNEDLIILHEEYRDSKIYQEIKLFLNEFRPEWRKHKELGSWAPEFCLHHIRMYEDMFVENEHNNSIKEWLTSVYIDMGDNYEDTKQQYQFARIESLRKEFESICEGQVSVDSNEEKQYDKEFEEFVATDGERIYFLF